MTTELLDAGIARRRGVAPEVVLGRPPRAYGPRVLVLGFAAAVPRTFDPASLVLNDLARCKWTPHNLDLDVLALPAGKPDLALSHARALLLRRPSRAALLFLCDTRFTGFRVCAPDARALIDAVEAEDLPCDLMGEACPAARDLLAQLAMEAPDLTTGMVTVPQASEFGGLYPLRRLQRGIQAAAVAFASGLIDRSHVFGRLNRPEPD